MGLYSDKCKRCGIRYGNQAVRGANTPAGREGMCAPCWQTVFEERRAAQRRPEPPKPSPVSPASPAMVADVLAKLAKLRDAGELTSEEFDIQKARLLSPEEFDIQKARLLGPPAKPVAPPIINFEIPRFPNNRAGDFDVILINDNGNVQLLRNAMVDGQWLTVPQTNALVQNAPIAVRKGGSLKAAKSLASLMRSWGMEVEVRQAADAQPSEARPYNGEPQDSPDNPSDSPGNGARTWSDLTGWHRQSTFIKALFIIAVVWFALVVITVLALEV